MRVEHVADVERGGTREYSGAVEPFDFPRQEPRPALAPEAAARQRPPCGSVARGSYRTVYLRCLPGFLGPPPGASLAAPPVWLGTPLARRKVWPIRCLFVIILLLCESDTRCAGCCSQGTYSKGKLNGQGLVNEVCHHELRQEDQFPRSLPFAFREVQGTSCVEGAELCRELTPPPFDACCRPHAQARDWFRDRGHLVV